jgi:hypothetical protein
VPRFKNAWSNTSTPPKRLRGVVLNEAMEVFMSQYLVKHKDNITLPSIYNVIKNAIFCLSVDEYELNVPVRMHKII